MNCIKRKSNTSKSNHSNDDRHKRGGVLIMNWGRWKILKQNIKCTVPTIKARFRSWTRTLSTKKENQRRKENAKKKLQGKRKCNERSKMNACEQRRAILIYEVNKKKWKTNEKFNSTHTFLSTVEFVVVVSFHLLKFLYIEI